MYFEPLKNIARNSIKLDANRIVNAIIRTPEFTNFIITLNTGGQLFDQGINSLGFSLGEYAPSTIEQKKEKGLPFDRITLFDTGEFYQSFELIAKDGDDFFTIDADPEKEDSNLFEDFGEDIVGLTDESKQILVEKLTRKLETELIKMIQ
jgi:hypothetical protein